MAASGRQRLLSRVEPAAADLLPRAPVPVPWGLAEALAALGVSLVLAVAGGTLVLLLTEQPSVARPLPPTQRLFDWANGVPVQTVLPAHQLQSDVLAYQFLALGVALSALWLIRVRFHLPARALGYSFPGWSRLLGSATGALLLVYAGLVVIWLVFDTLLPGYHLQGNARELLTGTNGHPPLGVEVMVFLWATVEAPLVEETLFRGILFQGLQHLFARALSRSWSVFVAAALSGLAFGIVHFQPHTLPILVFLGIVLAYVFERTRSIYPPALVHGIINGISVLALFNAL
jgi:membrane protease YdiL (CAAX protease family)